jgi:hypothetical protein
VCEGSQTGYLQTFPNATGGEIVNTCPAPNTFGYQFTTSSGTDLPGNDFGNFKTVTKSGTKFNDLNGDGDVSGDPGLPNWPINLYKSPNFSTTFATTTTDQNGDYSFPNLGPGTYRVCEGSLSGFSQTFPSATGGEIVNTCPAPNIFGYQFTTSSGTDLPGNDFGNFQTASKTGQKFNDLNGDGDLTGDPTIPGWTINLYKQDNGSFSFVTSDTTDSNGGYSFGPLAVGTYLVCEALPAGWIQTFPTASTVHSGETINGDDCPTGTGKYGYQFDADSGTALSGNDFGNFQLVTKSGQKFEDVNGDGDLTGDPIIANWTVNLYKKDNGSFSFVTSDNTDSNGNYSFPNLGPGTYLVCEALPTGWIQTFPNQNTNDPTGETINSTDCPSGTGQFGYQFTAESGNDLTNNDFGNFKLVTKSGMKWEDVNGNGVKDSGDNGLGDWTIRLYDAQGNQIDETTTASDGSYSFGPLGPGTYTVCEVLKPGWLETFPLSTTKPPTGESIATNCLPPDGTGIGYTFTTQSGVNLTTNDFGNFQEPTKSGVKWEDMNGDGHRDAGDDPLDGWTIQLYKGTTLVGTDTTDSNGAYSFPLLQPGTYTVCEVLQSGWVQTFPNAGTADPANESIATDCAPPNGTGFGYTFTAQSGVNLDANDFGNWVPPTKSGVKWNDVNGNGVRDTGDDGLSGWTIQALDPANGNAVVASAVTDANGNYELTFSKGGTFRVCEVLQTDWQQTFPVASTPDPNSPKDVVNIGDCPGGLNGYDVTVASRDALTGDSFGNHLPETPTIPPVEVGGITVTATPSTSSALAFTGSDTARAVWGATAALLLGALLLVVTRRRKRRSEV